MGFSGLQRHSQCCKTPIWSYYWSPMTDMNTLFSRKKIDLLSLAQWHNTGWKKNWVEKLVWICCWFFIWKSSGGWQGQTQIRFLWNTSRYTWIEGGQLSYGVLLLGAFHWRTSYARQFWHVPRLAAPCRIGPLRRTNR